MQITRKQLSRIIREEYLRSTPKTRPGQMMTEARANLLAEQILDESLWGNIKSGAASFFKGAGTAAKILGKTALEPFKAVGKAVQSAATAGKEAMNNAMTAVKNISNEAAKAAAEEGIKSLKSSLESSIKSETSNMLKKLVKAGMSEEEAKTMTSSLVSAALASAISGGGEGG